MIDFHFEHHRPASIKEAVVVFEHPRADGVRTLERMRSNVCRCTGYEESERAVRRVLDEGRAESAPRPGRPGLHAPHGPRSHARAGAGSHGGGGAQTS